MGATARSAARQVRAFLWPSLLLALALVLALASSVARRDGQLHASAFLALISLFLAAIASSILIPRLLARVKLDFLNGLRFFRFTSRGVSFILIVLIVAFSALNTGNNLLVLVLSVSIASLVASGLVSNLVLYGLKISLNLPGAIHAGQRAVFFLTLHNLKKFFPSCALRLRSQRGEDGGDRETETDFYLQEKHFPYVRPREARKLSLHCLFKRRGVYSVEGFEVRTSFPFGFFLRGRELDAHGSILVYPELLDLNPLFQIHPYLMGSREQLRKGPGMGLYNIRPYLVGESMRFVHWKSTAKLSRLMVKDFAAEEESPPNLVFSTFLPSVDEFHRAQFEKAVSYVASLCHYYQERGYQFSFTSQQFEAEVNSDPESYSQVMEYLACVEPSEGNPLDLHSVPWNSILFVAGSSLSLEGVPAVDYLTL